MAKNHDLYFSALEKMKGKILDNTFPFQSKLPSENILAQELNISRTTLRKVLEALKNDGLIESRKGSGSFVCNRGIARHIPVITADTDVNYRKTEILKGIQDSLNSIGFSSMPTFIEGDKSKEVSVILKLIKEGYKNFIIYPLSCVDNAHFFQTMMRKGINFVFIDMLPEKITCDYVASCNFLGGYTATKKLIELGHKEIAFCTFPSHETTNTIAERYNGYISALQQHKIKVSEKSIFLHSKSNMTYPEFCDYIANNKSLTAIFASTDELAIDLLKRFSHTKNPPAIIGFDNSVLAQSLNLTSIDQNFYGIGKCAAELLHKRIINPNKNYEHVYIPVKLIERGSSRKYNNE